ncbi:MAG: acetate--CoA ligase [Candidatus Diapherotrites archaeon]
MVATKWVTERDKNGCFWPNEEMKKKANVSDAGIYETAAKDPEKFWAEKSREGLEWFDAFSTAYEWKPPHYKWFLGGKINASYNCVDRHVKAGKGKKAAIIWVPEPANEKPITITYEELLDKVQRFANALKGLGVKKGDRVGIYLPMIPEVQVAMLACARLGAIHSVCFSAFSGESLKARLLDSTAKVLITSDGYYRRGAPINLKNNADIAVDGTSVTSVVVVKRAGIEVNMKPGKDYWFHELMAKASKECPAEPVDSEHMLFTLYTSGTTGRPKGIVHETGGYMTQAYWSCKWTFDLQDDDIFWCTADVGWVTGHTYNCYGPLSVGATMLFFEGAPDFPDKDRWWQVVSENKVTIFYTAPTAIRMFALWGDQYPQKHNLESIRLLGTVGEPIDEEAWMWYFKNIGGERCPIVDTWWQTETGALLISELPGIGPFIPTVAGRPFPGVTAEIVDDQCKAVGKGEGGFLILKSPFPPAMLRTIYNDDEKYVSTYFTEYGPNIYFTGDGARWFDDHNIRVTGRVDDVMKVAGHRLSTGEVENAVASHPKVSECAVVPRPHEIKNEVPIAFVVLKGAVASDALKAELMDHVKKAIGPTAKPEEIYFVNELPKTRSGKIMRRMLKSLLTNKPLGDTTTLQNPNAVDNLKQATGYKG